MQLRFSWLIILIGGMLFACTATDQAETNSSVTTTEMAKDTGLLLFVGTYTRKEGHVDGKAEGIYIYKMNPETGELAYVNTSPSTISPSYLAVHPSKKWLYAANEYSGDEAGEASVSAFRIDSAGRALTFINAVPSKGKYPCHVSVDPSGQFAMVANYVGGSVALYPIREDGGLEQASWSRVHPGDEPHAHMMQPDPAGNFVYANDLGVDQIFIYKLDKEQAVLEPIGKNVAMAKGAGPRHLDFHPNGKWVYVINELNGTVDAFHRNPETAALERFQTISTMKEGDERTAHSGDIHVMPSGKYLYATNRGEVNNIAMFDIDITTGELQLIGHEPSRGKTPRNFVIDPTGQFLLIAHQDSDDVFTFKISDIDGTLEYTGFRTAIPNPVCLKFY